MRFFLFKLLAGNSTASTEPELNQRPPDYCQILISNYSPPIYQLTYQWNLSYEDASTEMKLLYKVCYFLKLLAENSTGCTELDINQRPKDYCQILISNYSPPLYQLSYQWNLSYQDTSTEMKVLPYQTWYFSALLVENSTVSTELDLNQRPKCYWQIFISHNSPPLY